jgi:hypothetical protein
VSGKKPEGFYLALKPGRLLLFFLQLKKSKQKKPPLTRNS